MAEGLCRNAETFLYIDIDSVITKVYHYVVVKRRPI